MTRTRLAFLSYCFVLLALAVLAAEFWLLPAQQGWPALPAWLAAAGAGAVLALLPRRASGWRRLFMAAGFPVSAVLGGAVVVPAWAWLLPMGLLQLNAALENGYWYARSAEFMGKPIFDLLVWLRVPGDTIFSVGAVAICYAVARQWLAPKPVARPAFEASNVAP